MAPEASYGTYQGFIGNLTVAKNVGLFVIYMLRRIFPIYAGDVLSGPLMEGVC